MTMSINPFLARTTNATSNDGTSSSVGSDADFNPSEVMPAVASLQFSGDPGAMLAALTMASAKSQADIARKQRDEATDAQEKAEATEIQDLRDKANLQRIQGVVDGVCDFAQAGMDFASGMDTLDSNLDKAHAEAIKDGSDPKAPLDVRNANADTMNSLKAQSANEEADANNCKVGSKFVGGGKQIADGCFQGAITDKEADEKMHEASADAFKKIADDAHDDEKDAKDLLNKALDFYKEYVDAKNQTAMAAIHRA